MFALSLAKCEYRLTNQSFRAATGVADSRDAGRYLRELVDRGLLVMSGSRGNAVYRLPGESGINGSGQDDEAVLAALRAGATTRREIEAATGLHRNVVIHRLRQLREAGTVEIMGSTRDARWRIVTD